MDISSAENFVDSGMFVSCLCAQVGFNVAMSMLSLKTKPPHLSEEQRQYNWEHGRIDYLGEDSFDNILQQLDAKLATPPSE